jgi:hypothetical protein
MQRICIPRLARQDFAIDFLRFRKASRLML